MKKIHDPIGKSKDDVGNFKIPSTRKIDTPYFASLETVQLLYQTIFSLDV